MLLCRFTVIQIYCYVVLLCAMPFYGYFYFVQIYLLKGLVTIMDYKALRKSRGWTQIKAATELGISFVTWQRWELGGCKPSEENIKKLKEVFADELKQ